MIKPIAQFSGHQAVKELPQAPYSIHLLITLQGDLVSVSCYSRGETEMMLRLNPGMREALLDTLSGFLKRMETIDA